MLSSPRPFRLVLIAAIAAVLAACATPTSGSTTSPTAAPSPTSSQSPSPSLSPPSPTSSFDAADTSTWLITEAGIGRAEIGSQSAADALSPSFVRVDWCEGLESYHGSGPAPVEFVVITHPGEKGISGIGVRVPSDVAVTGPVAASPLTESGIGMGSTLNELSAAEPNGAFETGSEFPRYVVAAGMHWIMFEVSEAEPFVRGITVTEVLPPAGFCS